MSLLVDIAIAVLAAFVCYFGVALFRRVSISRGWVDVPNQRSSHSTPTPRGGGLVVVVICLVSYAAAGVAAPDTFSWGYFFGAALISGVSWLDDLYSLSIKWRLAVQVVSAVLAVVSSGYFTNVSLPGGVALTLGVFGPAVTVLWIVWMINAYNFMDGIDGIAGVQAIVAGIAWTIVAALIGGGEMTFFCAVIVGTAVGFLLHNWVPARIFLGDVGSAFFGYTFASIPLLLGRSSANVSWLPVAAIFFLWPFVFDTAYTLARRLARGERIWEPHRGHLYQGLIIAGYSHSSVATIYMFFAAFSAASFLVMLEYPGNIAVYPPVFLVLMTTAFVVLTIILTRPSLSERYRDGRS